MGWDSETSQQMAADVFETTWERLALLGCLLTAVGSFPAWFTLKLDPALATLVDEPEQIARGGIEGDGVLTLLFALLVVGTLAVVTYRTDDGPGWRSSGIGATLLTVLAYLDLQALRDQLAEYESQGGANQTLAESLTVDVHAALYVVIAGSILVTLAGLLGTVRRLRAQEATQTG